MKQLYTYKATLDFVQDGDSMWTFVDMGMRITRHVKLRLEDLNTREMKDGGQAAKDAAVAWLKKDLIVTTYKDPAIYDRYTARVWNASDPNGESLNDFLLRTGLAEYRKY